MENEMVNELYKFIEWARIETAPIPTDVTGRKERLRPATV